ncbi:MAG: ABC transporter permease [Candidatus Schekmanbacteria bacterium RIFCSPHIGHO2_02_FULL_38_11]|uniref:ABC transporter permease n=1 Tax=Candidatus Schekmanbacteria bacterium RIFCSPLOWO2_12_FULL_38_15 TaxID=1817883 RepID=A0A1F7SPZ9_9BACT|nr:MAG: ABC transporter permease [Candidatus Schekmanbacteria bacterium GWA2_38_9]OGL48406.1 MAG: ABC transporter permease [Candidatus Schekmanbacteria bacterium RIFCSPLOWO2_02_FULL_38_14]OGL52000.1 MAG: ABC transporter permease [Candidatus Schekmanbacteria bacterium RIFCSPHIGHO2_02_FULL_38_11]OGL55288.1 MAG: ABC transporter permease [Candidatus Schekmanbacteria bacterium RIFCSPLOWO2_12_FULL_38_15]
MKLSDIAINNLKRRKGKMIFLTIGLLIGITTIVTLVSITSKMSEDLGKKLDEYGANIIVTPKSDGLSLSYGGVSLGGMTFETKELNIEDIEKINGIKNRKNLSILAPKVIGSGEINGLKVMLVGVDFEKELRLKKWWKKAGYSPQGEHHNMEGMENTETKPATSPEKSEIHIIDFKRKNDVAAGYEAAKKLGLKVGDEITANNTLLRVTVILEETGSQDDHLIFLNLPLSQKILNKEGKLSMIEISAYCKDCPIEDMVSQISEKLPNAKVTALKQVVQGRIETLNQFKTFSLGISIVVVFIGSLVVFVTMMGSVNERTREIGIFRAIGYRQSHIMKVILLEAFIVSSLAGILGYVIGVGVSTLISSRMFPGIEAGVSFNYLIALGSVLLSVFIGMLASLYPARRAANMDPSEALRAL